MGCQEPPIELLRAPRASAELDALIRRLYADWTVIALRNYRRLPVGAREAAFAVTVEWLARGVQKSAIDAASFDAAANRRLMKALADHTTRELKHGERFARRCEAWLPRSVERRGPNGAAVTEPLDRETILQTLRHAPSNGSGAETAEVLEAVRHQWERLGRTRFHELDEDDVDDLVQDAVVRLLHPLTAACLTKANLTRRVRDIPINVLSAAAKRQRRHARRAHIDWIDEVGVVDGAA